jgi:hypothetical protein
MVLILPFVLVARNPIISCLAAPRSQVILTGRVALRPLRSLREPFSFPLNPGRPAPGWTAFSAAVSRGWPMVSTNDMQRIHPVNAYKRTRTSAPSASLRLFSWIST